MEVENKVVVWRKCGMCGQYFMGTFSGGNCPCGHYQVTLPEIDDSGDSASNESKRDIEVRAVGGDHRKK